MEKVRHAWVALAPSRRTRKGDSSQIDAVLSIESSLSAFNEDCEIRRTTSGCFCKKHGRPVQRDATRCDSFVRRRSFENYEDFVERFTAEYVRNVLGIKEGRNYKRLLGWIADAPSPNSDDRTQHE